MKDGAKLTAPDGGWGWVVLAATVPIIAINNSIFGTFSLLFGGLLKSNGADATMTAWIFNIGTAFWSMSSLLAGPLSNIYSHRVVSVTAGVLIATGLFLSHLINAAWQLFLTYSLFVGFGCGLIYSSSFLLINLYFNERRGLALGVFNASATLGRMLFPLAEHRLLELFTDGGTVLIVSAISMHLIPCAMLFRPVDHPRQQYLNGRKKQAGDDRNQSEDLLAVTNMSGRAPAAVTCSDLQHRGPRSKGRRRNSASDAKANDCGFGTNGSLERPDSCEPAFLVCPTSTPRRKRSSLHYVEVRHNPESAAMLSSSTPSNIHRKIVMRPRGDGNSDSDSDLTNGPRHHGVIATRKRLKYFSTLSSDMVTSPNEGKRAYPNSLTAPRSINAGSTYDIFGSSVIALDYGPKSTGGVGKRTPGGVDGANEEGDYRDVHLLKRIFRQLDFKMLKNPMLLILLFADCLYWLTYFNFVLMMPISVQESGLSRHDTATLLALPPVSDIVMRLCLPVMVDQGWLDCRTVYLLGLGMVLLSVVLFPFVNSIEMMYVCCLTFGVGCGSAVTHFGLVLVHYFGVDNLPSTKGFTMFSNGFSYLLLGPLLGLLRTSTGDFSASYYMLAVCMTVSLLLWTLEPWAKRYAVSEAAAAAPSCRSTSSEHRRRRRSGGREDGVGIGDNSPHQKSAKCLDSDDDEDAELRAHSPTAETSLAELDQNASAVFVGGSVKNPV